MRSKKINKINRYNLIGINNISSSYVHSISNMKLIDKEKEKEYAINIIENKQKLIYILFSCPLIAELFIEHFNKTRSSVIHTKYIFELSKYISEENDKIPTDELEDDSVSDISFDDGIGEGVKKGKKNIFNDINNIINTKIKSHIDAINASLKQIKTAKGEKNLKEICKDIGNSFMCIYLNENIIREMYSKFMLAFDNIEPGQKKVVGLPIEDYMERYESAKIYHKNILLYTEKMILSNLRLVISVSKKYINKRIDFMDIVQEGNLGLLKAIKKFDYKRGFKFSTYATWWIKQSITRDIYDNYDAVRIPIHMKENISKIFKNINLIDDNLNYEEKIKEIMKHTTLDEKKIRKVLKIQRGYISIDKNNSDVSDDEVVDFIDNKANQSPFYRMALKDKRRIIGELVGILNEREKSIFMLRFLEQSRYDKEMTLEMIGYLKGITRERVRQIISKIINKLVNNKENQKYKGII